MTNLPWCRRLILLGIALVVLPACRVRYSIPRSPDTRWAIHDIRRPVPPVVSPEVEGPPTPPPPDAQVLFDGTDLSSWTDNKGNTAPWKTAGGYMEVVPKAGSIQTRQAFGDSQLHMEWATPTIVKGSSQERGNSGVFLMQRYEVQILDGFDNRTYADGMAGAVYGQHPPLVNACRPPGAWQTLDITFRAPRFDSRGKLLESARMTVMHNNVLVQDNVVLSGPTAHKKRPRYSTHPARLPLMLQDHGNPVRFRNIWIRELGKTS